MIGTVIQDILLVLIAGHLGWTVLMHVCTWYYFRRRDRYEPTVGYAPAVSIIKPTKGVDQSAFENFASFCQQAYGGEYEVVFCVEDPSDPAVPVIKRVMQAYPACTMRLIFSGCDDTYAFGKLKNMIAGVAASAHAVIIFSDSDARVGPHFLRETVGCMRDPHVGIGFGVPAYTGAQDWAAALQSMFVNGLALRITTLHLCHVFQGAIGTTMVVRRQVLHEIGGLERVGWQIGDDIQLARMIRQHGYRIHLLGQPARVVHHQGEFAAWWGHVQRWLVIIRHYWPVLFVLMHLVDLALWWSILYLIIALVQGSNIWAAWALVFLVVSTAMLSTVAVNLHFGHTRYPWRFAWVVVLQDLLRLPLLVHGCVTNKIVWRGRTLRVARDGNTSIVEPPAAAHDHA